MSNRAIAEESPRSPQMVFTKTMMIVTTYKENGKKIG
jgi:hypothetical protein